MQEYLKMNPEEEKHFAKMMTQVIFRDSIIEDLHNKGAVLNDSVMEILNKDICNRMYSVLQIFLHMNDDAYELLDYIFHISSIRSGSWDDPEIVPELDPRRMGAIKDYITK